MGTVGILPRTGQGLRQFHGDMENLLK